MKKANNVNVIFLSLFSIVDSEGNTQADLLRLATIKQPVKTRNEETDARFN